MAFGVKERQKDGERKPTRAFSKRQESGVAKALGGSRTPNSGATPWIKGDVIAGDFLIECKTKTKPSESIAVHKEWLEKNSAEALMMGKRYSAVAIQFGPGERNYFVIDEELFAILKETLSAGK